MLTHREPVVRFKTKMGRRVFLVFGSIGLVLLSAWVGLVALNSIVNDTASAVIPWLVLIVCVVGIGLFGFIAIMVLIHHLGAKGKIALVMSPVGFTDRTQVSGPLELIPWSVIAEYGIEQYGGQDFLAIYLRDPEAYQQVIGSSRIMRSAFQANSKIFHAPVHLMTLKHLEAENTDILRMIGRFTGLRPGQRASSHGNNVG